MWRASSVLISLSPKSVLVFLLVVGCVGFVGTRDGNVAWDLLLCILYIVIKRYNCIN